MFYASIIIVNNIIHSSTMSQGSELILYIYSEDINLI